jgi:putative transposase
VDGKHVVAGDLGEIHPITLADDAQAQVIACRELRATRQYTNKTLAEIAHLQSQCTRHSRRWWRLERRKRRFLEKQARRVRDMEHKASRAAVDFAQERGAAVIAIGDVRDIADGKRLNSHSQQKISQWSHGTLRNFITYKANTVGITVVSTVSEVDTTKTCPNPACNHRHKPTGRIYRCPACGLVAHRDVVGAVNIRSRFLHGAVGCLSPPPNTTYRHPYYQRTPHRRGKRSPQVTGHVAGKRTPHRNRGSSPYPTPRQNRRNSHQDKRAATGLR